MRQSPSARICRWPSLKKMRRATILTCLSITNPANAKRQVMGFIRSCYVLSVKLLKRAAVSNVDGCSPEDWLDEIRLPASISYG